jgi:hypothetical protein
MDVTPETVTRERDRWRERAPGTVALLNDVRAALGEQFGTDVAPVGVADYRREVDAVFADGDRAVNAAALAGLLRSLDVAGDYPGLVVDELLGRHLAATIAGGQPLALLAGATFHYADVAVEGPADAEARTGEAHAAGLDDLDAALAAGFQTRLPGWPWRERESPFAVEPVGEDPDGDGDADDR